MWVEVALDQQKKADFMHKRTCLQLRGYSLLVIGCYAGVISMVCMFIPQQRTKLMI